MTVTHPAEAELAAAAGADCLVVQGAAAGAHRGTFTNGGPTEPSGGVQLRHSRPRGPPTLLFQTLGTLELLASVREVTSLPVVAAGGIMEARRSPVRGRPAPPRCRAARRSCGARKAERTRRTRPRWPTQVRADGRDPGVQRPAGPGLVNGFMRAHPDAPAAYPEINNATRPLRAAAAAAGDSPDELMGRGGYPARRPTCRLPRYVELLCGA